MGRSVTSLCGVCEDKGQGAVQCPFVESVRMRWQGAVQHPFVESVRIRGGARCKVPVVENQKLCEIGSPFVGSAHYVLKS